MRANSEKVWKLELALKKRAKGKNTTNTSVTNFLVIKPSAYILQPIKKFAVLDKM